jgi:hypothetical protein
MGRTPKVFRLGFHAVLLGIATLLVGASPAQAGVLDNPVSCNSHVFEKPFLRWEEPVPFDYVLAPDGGFERRAQNWQLTGRARVVRGNESFRVHRRADSRSLYLPPGSEATSPAMCAGVEYPTLRLFARNRSGGATAILKVEMAFQLNNEVTWVQLLPLLGRDPVTKLPILGGDLTASTRWDPTLPMVLPSAFLIPATLSENPPTAAIAFRFTPQGDADWWIDDAYVDPYRKY